MLQLVPQSVQHVKLERSVPLMEWMLQSAATAANTSPQQASHPVCHAQQVVPVYSGTVMDKTVYYT
ncbi:hypothetical protein DPMN_058579 [Dreissena polymorpha]|uniref:Uncharacterized protein n=1 Tax=Dreissena polymorpha TaxID=45954 RepID=A0A9D4HDU9_DREPO|nr:hypothetical protein DPMN_058579 [Dreissena polymorpha]